MPTFTQFIQTPQAFAIQTVIGSNPEFMDKFIEYLTVVQNPLLCNERQCYLYPSKVADILSVGMVYRLLIEKKKISEDRMSYPFLQKLFLGIKNHCNDPTLLGYCSRILISLVRKTPQIYEFIKDNQQLMIDVLKDDQKLNSLRQFLCLLLTQSTMELYVFLKSMVVRNLIYRVVEDENVGVPVYRCITYFYKQLTKALDEAIEEEKAQLKEVCKLFEEEHFVTLFVLKMDSTHPLRNSCIADFLCMVCSRSADVAQVLSLQIDTILDYLEQYQQSETFMDEISKDHVAILGLLVELAKMDKLTHELVGQLIKRLLVYSNVHSNNNVVHNLFYSTISCCKQQGKGELLNQFSILDFFIKNKTQQRLGFMALRRRVFKFWIEHSLDEGSTEQQKKLIRQDYAFNSDKVKKSKYYKQIHGNSSMTSFTSNATHEQAKMPSSSP